MSFGDPICNPRSFWEEARFQVVCACCGVGGEFHAHHVVDKQTLKARCGLRGDALYDTRNALRLCAGTRGNRCHMQFEYGGVGKVEITTRMLTDENVVYAFEALEGYAADFLRHQYEDVQDPDPRILELELGVR